MKHQLSLFASSELTAFKGLVTHEIIKRFAVLSGQHFALTEKLRELHDKTTPPVLAQFEWHDLKNEVVSLRYELENFKQVF